MSPMSWGQVGTFVMSGRHGWARLRAGPCGRSEQVVGWSSFDKGAIMGSTRQAHYACIATDPYPF